MRGLKDRLIKQVKGEKRSERRVGYPPVPTGLEIILTEAQANFLRNPADRRWSLAFVRSQGLIEPLVIVRDELDNSHGILSNDGMLHKGSVLKVRTYGLLKGQ